MLLLDIGYGYVDYFAYRWSAWLQCYRRVDDVLVLEL